MSSIKPIKLYVWGGVAPNPWKVVIILEELKVPYELVNVGEVKGPEHIALNPNGRVPTMVDPNTNVTTWESGSNIEYLIDVYGKDSPINYTSSPEKYWQSNWKHFQMSGQGPYFGQLAWFKNFHHEKLESAVERYTKEVSRVHSVIEQHLSKTGKPYLVGDHVSYADLMFITWDALVTSDMFLGAKGAEEWKTTYPKSYEWHQKLLARESVKKVQEIREKYKTH